MKVILPFTPYVCVTWVLIFINTLIYTLTHLFPSNIPYYIQYGFAPYYFQLTDKDLYTYLSPLTYMFLHLDRSHIINNMIGLFIVGGFLEPYLGKVKFFLYYVLSGVLASFIYYLFASKDQIISTVGASGAISGMLMIFFITSLQLKKFNVLVSKWQTFLRISITVFCFYFIISQLYHIFVHTQSKISFMMHLGGFISGLMIIAVHNKITNKC